jgi:hypothetical protein
MSKAVASLRMVRRVGNGAPQGPDHGGECSMITSSVLRQEVLRTVLREALNRYRNELLDDGERQLFLDRTKRLRRQLEIRA